MIRRTLTFCAVVGALVLAGTLLTGCDLTPVTLKGTLTLTSDGSPAIGVPVALYTDSAPQTLVATTATGTDGAYSFHQSVAPDGNYRILFSSSDWYNGASDWSGATTVALDATTPTTIDETLTPATGMIGGTVTANGTDPVTNGTVEAINTTIDTVVASVPTTTNGHYRFASLPATTYRLRYTAPGLTTRYNASATEEGAAPIVDISDGHYANPVNTNLATESAISGTVTDNSNPVAGVTVTAIDKADGHTAGSATSDANGQFTVGTLNATDYTLTIDPHNTAYFKGPWSTSTSAEGTVVTVTPTAGANTAVGTVALVGHDCDQTKFTTGNVYSGVGLAGKNLHNCDLEQQDFTYADLTGTDLTNTNLSQSRFSDANLNGADLTSTQASQAIFDGADFTGTNLTNADLSGADLHGDDLHTATVSGAGFQHASLDFVNLSGLLLDGADFTSATAQFTDFSGAQLTNSNLTSVDASGADFSGANLFGAKASSANFNGVDIDGTDLRLASGSTSSWNLTSGGVTGTPAALDNGWAVVNGTILGPWVNAAEKYFDNADLSGLDLQSTNLHDTDLSGANLTGTNLNHADLSLAVLDGTNLTDATLQYPVLEGAEIRDATVSGMSLSIDNSTSQNSLITSGLVGTPAVLNCGNCKILDGYLIAPYVELGGANLTSQDLGGLDLAHAHLKGTDLAGANLNGVDFDSADLSGANLAGASLYGANLASTDLTGANLAGAHVIGASLDGATLTGATLSGADLTGTTLVGAALANAKLYSAVLAGADLSGATLTGVLSNGITGTPAALPAGWSIVGGVLTASP